MSRLATCLTESTILLFVINLVPCITPFSHIKWKLRDLWLLKSVPNRISGEELDRERIEETIICRCSPMLFITVKDGLVGISQITSHSGDITRERGEPSSDEILRLRADHLIDHAQVVRIDISQIR